MCETAQRMKHVMESAARKDFTVKRFSAHIEFANEAATDLIVSNYHSHHKSRV